jgi:hypothetical protein
MEVALRRGAAWLSQPAAFDALAALVALWAIPGVITHR